MATAVKTSNQYVLCPVFNPALLVLAQLSVADINNAVDPPATHIEGYGLMFHVY
jgi:hypothetical protein